MRSLNHAANWIRRHPVLVFYLLTFLISWGGLALMLKGEISSHAKDINFFPLYFITVAGPFISGIVLTGLYEGRKGYSILFRRLVKWRVNAKWYAAALFIPALTVFAALFILYIFSPVFLPGIFSSGESSVASTFGLSENNKLQLVLFVVMLGLFNGFVEEVGWTGFVTPRLNLKNHLVVAGLGLGMMWGLWHGLSNFIGSAVGNDLPLPFYLAFMLFSFMPPCRIIMSWIYKNTRSLLIGIIMHAGMDIFWLLSMPGNLTATQRVLWYAVWAALLWICVLIILFSKKKRGHSTRIHTSSPKFIYTGKTEMIK